MRGLWEATTALADTLQDSRPLHRFAGTWRGEPQLPGSELASQLQEILAGFGVLRWQPFLLALRLEHIPGGQALAGDPAAGQFRQDSAAVSAAMVALVEWLRSRMPRYPIRFKLPYTDPLSSRVADDGFADGRWPWLMRARRTGFQAQRTVAPMIARVLEVDEAPVRQRLATLDGALQSSPAWQRYITAAAALTKADEAVLDEVLLSFRAQTKPAVLELTTGDRVWRRFQHRDAALRLAEMNASGRGDAVAEYYTAFRGVDRTLASLVALLSQLLIYGPPELAQAGRTSWRRNRDSDVQVSIATQNDLPRLNDLVIELRAELTPLAGLIAVEGVHFSFKRRGEDFDLRARFDGVLLPDSAGLSIERTASSMPPTSPPASQATGDPQDPSVH